jgi:ADP-heptose:LPS heptosyltransferase
LPEKLKLSTVYLVRKRALGDVLWLEPVIAQLAAKHKKIIVYTKFIGLFENYPQKNVFFKEQIGFWGKIKLAIDQIFNRSFFSINLDYAYERNRFVHILEAYCRKAKIPFKRVYPKLFLSDNEKAVTNNDGPYIVLHLRAKSAAKNFRNVYGIDWPAVIFKLQQLGFNVLEIGDFPGLFPDCFRSTTLREMIRTINSASMFVGIDSGPSHIAASLGIPSVSFFGAVNPDYRHFKDIYKGIILQEYCEFAGCYHTNPTAYLNHSCRLVGDSGTPKCCKFSTDQVMEAIAILITRYEIKNDRKTI